ncbi:MAG: CPBP family intramembrane metalloprotease [Leptospiraceae bacterium]|nr:CPBP family intramembrane metalloprotease [Leptospiraceae bacterium]
MRQPPSQTTVFVFLRFFGLALGWFALLFLCQSILWGPNPEAHFFSRPVHFFGIALSYPLSLLLLAFIYGRADFGTLLVYIHRPQSPQMSSSPSPCESHQSAPEHRLRSLFARQLRLIHTKTPSLWILIWIEIPVALAVLETGVRQALSSLLPPLSGGQPAAQNLPFVLVSKQAAPDFLSALLSSRLWGIFTLLALVALTEELIFRGLSRGLWDREQPANLRSRWQSGTYYIAVNALFATGFLNPWLIGPMFISGLYYSWLYGQSDSLPALLIIRLVSLATALVLEVFIGTDPSTALNWPDHQWWFLGLALIVFLNANWFLVRRNRRSLWQQEYSRP